MALVERYHSSQELRGSIPDESSKPDVREASDSKGNKQGISLVHSEERAKHVGILALEVYFPNTYVGPSPIPFRSSSTLSCTLSLCHMPRLVMSERSWRHCDAV